jgi:Na+/serine symporter
MNSEELKQLYQQYFYYILVADIAFGLIFGLVPLFLGIKKNKRNLGIISLVTSGLVGAISPILSLIAVAVFTLLIFNKGGNSSASAKTDLTE